MRAVLGLGNPGKKYKLTRHNIGFMFIDFFSEEFSLQVNSYKNNYYYSESKLNNSSFLLIKPDTYVNLTGTAVLNLTEDFNISLDNILFIYDDINLKFGEVRLKLSGGDGGHNGIKSIIDITQSKNFSRIRIGIGNKFNKGEMVDYVLDKISLTEMEILTNSFSVCSQLTKAFISGGKNEMLNLNSQLKNKLELIN